MPETRYLIVNADDFGLSPGVNRGIITAFERGIVTSASLMTRYPAAADASIYAKSHPELSLGLHLDLGEWIFRGGEWVRLYSVVTEGDAAAISLEVSRQLADFRRLMGRDPTHLDSHQHVHREQPTRSIIASLARSLRVPLREAEGSFVSYCGDFYGQTAEGEPCPGIISVRGLVEILSALSPGVTELGCHPGAPEELETPITMYNSERSQETEVLCDQALPGALVETGIELCSFLTAPLPLSSIVTPSTFDGGQS